MAGVDMCGCLCAYNGVGRGEFSLHMAKLSVSSLTPPSIKVACVSPGMSGLNSCSVLCFFKASVWHWYASSSTVTQVHAQV